LSSQGRLIDWEVLEESGVRWKCTPLSPRLKIQRCMVQVRRPKTDERVVSTQSCDEVEHAIREHPFLPSV